MKFLLLNEYLKWREVYNDAAFFPPVWQEANVSFIWGGNPAAAIFLHPTVYSCKGETMLEAVFSGFTKQLSSIR